MKNLGLFLLVTVIHLQVEAVCKQVKLDIQKYQNQYDFRMQSAMNQNQSSSKIKKSFFDKQRREQDQTVFEHIQNYNLDQKAGTMCGVACIGLGFIAGSCAHSVFKGELSEPRLLPTLGGLQLVKAAGYLVLKGMHLMNNSYRYTTIKDIFRPEVT